MAPYLIELTTDEQTRALAPGFCRGEMITAIAMTEPGPAPTCAALRTAAPARRRGRISGSKTFITNGIQRRPRDRRGAHGDARRGRGISLFVVEEGADGFTRGRKLDKVGQHEADTAELFFDDVPVRRRTSSASSTRASST